MITRRKNKKAGFEMSMTTLVVIVIAVVMLILGLVFVRQIFGTATDSIDIIDEQVKDELINLFGEDGGEDVVVKLGTQKSAKIRQGTQGFGFVFGIAPDTVADLNDCRYTITSTGQGERICTNTDPWFIYGMNNLEFDDISENSAFALIKLDIPKQQSICDQKFKISITCPGWIRSTYFNIQIIKKGFL